LLADVINFEHWEQKEKLKQHIDNIGLVKFEQVLEIMKSIKSVKFYNSICFIEKLNLNSSNQIGKRVVEGENAVIGIKAKNGQNIS
jgi:hypothetical protein